MAAIAGISKRNASALVAEMLGKMSHRGKAGTKIIGKNNTTSGICWNSTEEVFVSKFLEADRLCDFKGSGHFAWAKPETDSFTLFRDELGVTPLYYGWDQDGHFCFSSEVKALLPYITGINELKPGTLLCNYNTESYYNLTNSEIQEDKDPDRIAVKLKAILENSVRGYIRHDIIGSWLSGGLDSSTICALASKYVGRLFTFAVGLPDAPDLEYAREISNFIRSRHHEVIVSENEIIKTLPELIFHLESFDALLVRSSITNFIVAEKASHFVPEVLSGEGGDELFAGYEYLKSLPVYSLPAELIKITNNLHNTALQRVDRCSSAHGTTAYVPFLHQEVVDYAFSIPVKYKIHQKTEKWILRKAMEGELPERVLQRPKSKFWEGAGVGDIISSYAEKKIKDAEFKNERKLANGWTLNTKEELLYYRIFREHFGTDLELNWMGRTEGSPVV
jgi:asparagine synthase (glutamine-hydrolysing)